MLASGRRFLEPIDLFLYDPSGLEMARWTARNAVSGPIHINYHLASETPVGKWKLSAKMRSYKQGKPSQLNIKVNMSKAAEFHGIFSKNKNNDPLKMVNISSEKRGECKLFHNAYDFLNT